MKSRYNKILELLTKEKKIEVNELSQILGVSNVTIRKDLDALEEKGIIKRGHGYAILANKDDINGRLAYHYEIKKRIAQKAAELIHDGDTIMIESGSCCAILADTIASQKEDVTIVTNSAFIANYIRSKQNAKVILLGGAYQNDSQVMVGPIVAQCAKNFCVDQLFIGADGYMPRTGFTNKDHLRAQAVRDMAEQAEHVIVLTESEKFTQHSVVPLQLNDRIDTIITDDHIPEDTKQLLLQENKQILTVKGE